MVVLSADLDGEFLLREVFCRLPQAASDITKGELQKVRPFLAMVVAGSMSGLEGS